MLNLPKNTKDNHGKAGNLNFAHGGWLGSKALVLDSHIILAGGESQFTVQFCELEDKNIKDKVMQ